MTTDDPAADMVDSLINEALHTIEVSYPPGWPWLRAYYVFTLTAGDNQYGFSDFPLQANVDETVSKIVDVRITSQQTYTALEYISVEEADRTYTSTVRTGLPEAFSVDNEFLYLYPTPDAAYETKIRAVITETDLSDTVTAPVLPPSYHGAIIAGACMLYYEALQDTARAQAFAQRFDGWISKMIDFQREVTRPPRVRLRSSLA